MDKTVLKNGAKIMEMQKCKETGYVVLAMNKERDKDGFTEYVTWLTDDELNCFHGNYFISSINAVKDYEKRVNQHCLN